MADGIVGGLARLKQIKAQAAASKLKAPSGAVKAAPKKVAKKKK